MTCSERSLKTGGSGDGTGSGVGRGSTCSDESGSLRETGIEIVGEVPWGTHFCQFYQTKQDLIDTLIPYITAGLESNEFCMWITSEPLGVDEAAQALRESVPDLDRRFAEGQIEIIPHTAWYLRDGVFDQQRVLDGWVLKLNAALAKGYVGLRLTGNTFWLEKDDWQDFTDYEEAINLVIGNYRMLAACTYSLEKCGASEIADVVSNHEFAMMKRRGKWTVIESSTVKQAGKALQAALDELETRTSELEKLNLDLAAANGTLEVANEELAVTNEEIEAANEELRVSEDELRCEIEERIRVERELQRLNRTLLAHSKSDQAMMRSTDESDYLQEVCRIIVEDCGHAMVWIGYAEEDEAKTVRPVAYAGFEEGYLKTLNITWADTENGRGPTGTAIRTGKPSACRNMLTDPQFAPWRKEAMKRGYASSMVFPLIGDGKTFGTITIYSKELDSFTEDEVGLLTGLANDLAYGITAIRLRAARAQAEEALRESEQRVRLKLDSILSPEGDIGNLDLADILDTPPIQSLMDSFYELVHIPMAIIDLKGKVLVGVGWQDICTQFHRVNPKTCKHCIESDTQLTQGVPPGESRLYKCKNNMWDIATPIIVGGEHVGNLFSGQFFFDDEPLDYGFFRSQAEKYGFNERDYIAALERVPRLSRESLNEGMAFFTKLAGILSRLSYSNIKLARSLTQRDALMGSLRRSEERLTRAQEISHLGSWELDLVNNRLSWSDEVYRIFGLQPQEFAATYEAFLEGVHPGDRAAVDAAYSDSLRDGRSSYEIEHRVVRRSTGEVRWVHEKCEHVEDETGRIIRSVGMVLDITDRKRMEGELQSLALFPDENPNPVMRVAADGSLLYFNVASKALLQYLGEDSEPTLPTELLMAVADANNVGSVREIDMDFEDRIFAFVLAPVINQGYVNLYGQDITDRVDFERQKEELYEREHHIADVLQKALVPDTVYDIPGCDIAVRYEAALKEAEVGGDFYDIFDLGDNKIGLLIGDVAGKGLAAAIQVAAARHSVRSYAYIDPRPERVMTLANNALCKDPQQGITMLTAFFAVLDLELGVMTYANGGHETPVLRRSDGGVEELAVEGRALGVMADYEYPDRGVILTPGDLVTMVTDGVTEARPNSNDLFGLERMKSFLSGKRARSAAELADGLLAAAKTHAGGDLRDDAAILVFGLRKEEKAR